MRSRHVVGLAGLCALGLSAGSASADPVLRKQVNQKGDFVLLGNTLGYSCDTGVPPVVGTAAQNMCGSLLSDTAPDLFWRADAPGAGQATADLSIAPTDARSTAVLKIPQGATITDAFLYWSARSPTAAGDTSVVIERPGNGGFTANAQAIKTYTLSPAANVFVYQSVADVTALVKTNGPGAYRISDVLVDDVRNVDNNWSYAGWWMVVFYSSPNEAPRNLTLFDSLDLIPKVGPPTTISGFLVPPSAFDAKLGIVAWEGDGGGIGVGDSIKFNGNVLSDAVNPGNNFFNGSRSYLGVPVTNVGDLPQLTGDATSMSGIDLDVVDIKNYIAPGQTSATIDATSNGEFYLLGGFITSISTIKPDYTTSTKTAVDLNGGQLVAGDVIEYTITAINSGNDTAINVVLSDPLPSGVTYVPGSLQITTGPNTGAKTDIVDADQAEYNLGTKTLTVRLGVGANGMTGGTMAPGTSSQIKFKVTVNPGASGSIANQGLIGFAGQQGSPPENTPTDDGAMGAPGKPTVVVIAGCTSNADCAAPTPVCDTAMMPGTCVQCLVNADCQAPATCNPLTKTCACVPSGAEICDGKDNDCDGQVDEGFNVGGACSVGVGACANNGTLACNGNGGASCSAMAGVPGVEVCGDGVDNDCDGALDEGCGLDDDNDGIPNETEKMLGTNPNDADSDDDGVIDGQEPQPGADSDGDGIINALDPDSDNDGLKDGTELGLGCGNPATNVAAGNCVADADNGATKTDPLDPDTDNGGLSDGAEDKNKNGKLDAGETDPTTGHGGDDDSDGDGLPDAVEVSLGSNPNDVDTDDDGVPDGQEPEADIDTDKDGIINLLDPDSDNDGLKDGTELGFGCNGPGTDAQKGNCVADADNGATVTDPLNPDTDGGGVSDGGEDKNKNGVVDAGETDPTNGNGADDDSDGDGVSDLVEEQNGTDPNDADSDDDGVIDGQEPKPTEDSDGDGIINALDPDSDNDGLKDGTELGLGCGNPATDVAKGNCVADADNGATKTDPLDPDTDDGGVNDGVEDKNKNGSVDPGETNPTTGNGGDDDDSDGDGVPDDVEVQNGTDPNDADSDDDGVIDGQEPSPTADTDGDGTINALDPDSDGDGLKDGTELGLGCTGPGTDASKGNCVPDGDDGATKTDPLDPDTDDGGVKDGDEDKNKNGVVDAGETDPTTGHGGDDKTKDSDGDGVPDDVEVQNGTDPNDADSDDDGVIDGQEPKATEDSDGDGKINALDPDSDNDGLKDGTEIGLDCSNPATDTTKGNCVPDGDKGATVTDPLDPDTDNGGVKDGDEDTDKDGVVDSGERDPNKGSDDPAEEVLLTGDGVFSCATRGGAQDAGQSILLGAALAALAVSRRRRKAS